MPERYAVMLGSGFDELVLGAAAETVETPFGAPSAPLYSVNIAGTGIIALPRHGTGHTIPPHAINYRANIAALEAHGIDAIIALNTVGVVTSIRDGGQIAVPDQIIDYTWGRAHTFCTGGDAGVRHIDFTEPLTASLRSGLLASAEATQVDCFDGGTYAAIQGPRLETAAEIDRLERDGADFVGMTGMPEAALAAEAGIDYAFLALVVNRAAGRGDRPIHADVEANSARCRAQVLSILEHFFAAGRDA